MTTVFDTRLLSINGVPGDEAPDVGSAQDDQTADAPSQSASLSDQAISAPSDQETGSESLDKAQLEVEPGSQDGECKLLGEFAILVQGSLGLLALFSVVWKRYRERPRRPVKVWSFDVSKQVFGSALLHIANLAVSTMGGGDYEFASSVKEVHDDAGRRPNPCSLYLINIAVDVSRSCLNFERSTDNDEPRQPSEYQSLSCT